MGTVLTNAGVSCLLAAPDKGNLNVEDPARKSAALSEGRGQVCILLSPHICQLGQSLRACSGCSTYPGLYPKSSTYRGRCPEISVHRGAVLSVLSTGGAVLRVLSTGSAVLRVLYTGGAVLRVLYTGATVVRFCSLS